MEVRRLRETSGVALVLVSAGPEWPCQLGSALAVAGGGVVRTAVRALRI